MSLPPLLPLAGLVLVAASFRSGAPVDDEAHARELLRHFAGTWDTESTYGDYPPSKGSEEVKVLAHGLSATISSTSPMGPGQTFEGHGIFGYDPHQKKWIHVWVDNTDPNISISEGTWSEDGNVFTIEDDINMGSGPTRMVLSTTITGAETREFRMAAKDAPAEAPPMIRMTYKRHAP